MTRGAIAALLGAMHVTACSRAFQSGPEPEIRPPYAHFLEQTYISHPNQPPRLLYEAQAAANVTVLQTLERAGSDVRHDTTNAKGRSEWRYAHMGVITPNFVIRQLTDSSAAVRTPSFKRARRIRLRLVRVRLRRSPTPYRSARPATSGES